MILVIGDNTFIRGSYENLIEQLCMATVDVRNAVVHGSDVSYDEVGKDISENILFNLRRKDFRE